MVRIAPMARVGTCLTTTIGDDAMKKQMMVAATGAMLLLAGCAGLQASSGPSIAATSPGPGAPPLRQLVAEQPHSADAADGTAVIAGAKGGGRPKLLRSAPTDTSLGAAPDSINGYPLIGPRSHGGA
jgi:hypothetical protein